MFIFKFIDPNALSFKLRRNVFYLIILSMDASIEQQFEKALKL